MRIAEYGEKYPDEASFKKYLREVREEHGLKCTKCGHDCHYWKNDKECWECKKCRRRTSLKSGTVMHYSKLLLQYWFLAIHLLSSTKKASQRWKSSINWLRAIKRRSGQWCEKFEKQWAKETKDTCWKANLKSTKVFLPHSA